MSSDLPVKLDGLTDEQLRQVASAARLELRERDREELARDWPEPWMAPLLEAVARSTFGNIRAAHRLLYETGHRFSRKSIYRWREVSEEFDEALSEAVEEATDFMEVEVARRAFNGVERPVFQGGREVGKVREFSDLLAMFTLKARRPEKFRERHELTGPGGGAVEHAVRILLPDNGRHEPPAIAEANP